MNLKSPELSWISIRDFLVQEGFEEYYENEWYSHLRKGKNVVGIPKLKIVPSMYLDHIISSSEVSEKKFLNLINTQASKS